MKSNTTQLLQSIAPALLILLVINLGLYYSAPVWQAGEQLLNALNHSVHQTEHYLLSLNHH